MYLRLFGSDEKGEFVGESLAISNKFLAICVVDATGNKTCNVLLR